MADITGHSVAFSSWSTAYLRAAIRSPPRYGGRPWADESLRLLLRCVDSVFDAPRPRAPLSPPCEGGVGGVVPAQPITRLADFSFYLPRCDSDTQSRNRAKCLESKAEKPATRSLLIPVAEVGQAIRMSKLCVPTPPGPPFARGGKESQPHLRTWSMRTDRVTGPYLCRIHQPVLALARRDAERVHCLRPSHRRPIVSERAGLYNCHWLG
jgi:hypothetical protein